MSDNETSYSAYREAVEEIGKEARAARDVSDAVHEGVDGSWWTIYTHASIAVLAHSQNDDRIFDDMGSDALSGCDSMSEVYTRAAYYAMCADVHEWIDANPAEEEEEEEEDTSADTDTEEGV